MDVNTSTSLRAPLPTQGFLPFNLSQITSSKFMFAFFSSNTFRPTIENTLISFYVLLGTSGFLFNAILIILVLRSSTLQYFPYNILLLNQMVSNIFMACISIPFTLFSLLYRNWDLGWFLCKSIPTIQGIGVCVNATAVTTIAIDRYLEMRRSHFPASGVYYSTFRRMASGSVIIWIVGIIFGSPFAYYQVHQTFVANYSIEKIDEYYYETNIPTIFYVCKEEWPPYYRSAYSVLVFIFQGIIPSVTLAITSALIVRHVERQGGVGGNGEGELQNVLPQADNGDNTIRDPNISRTLLIITLSFTLFWMPLHILNTLLDFGVFGLDNSSYEDIYLYSGIAHLIAMTSIPLNAIVYGYLTPSIRRECCFCKSTNGNAQDGVQMVEMN